LKEDRELSKEYLVIDMNSLACDPNEIKFGDMFKFIDKSQTDYFIIKVDLYADEKNKSSEERHTNI
jgi:hypothetical protein